MADRDQSSGPLIQVESLVKKYGPVAALDEVSLSINQGEFVALLGPSGCGKTTLLRAIAGFIEPTAGDILIEGKSVLGLPPNHRPVNTVFQNYALFPHHTVFDNVAFGPRRQKLTRQTVNEQVAEALAIVGMESFAKRYPVQLSGGQQQRVALARAIVNRPKVLLLDEPLGALDLQLRRRMQLELKRLHERLNITFLLVTHDQDEAMAMADRIAVMNAGKIIQVGTGAEIYNDPNSRFVGEFIGEANFLECEPIEGGRLGLKNERVALPYTYAGPAAERISLLVRPENIELNAAKDGGDAVFLDLTVRDKVVLGSAVKIYTSTAAGTEVVIQTTQREDLSGIAGGVVVRARWKPSDGKVLVR
ncbi:MAG: ABC transporter ATP-binding protein [Reyranellaceae bacterium]